MQKTVVMESFVAQGFKTCTDFAQRSSFLRWQGRRPRWSERLWMEAPLRQEHPRGLHGGPPHTSLFAPGGWREACGPRGSEHRQVCPSDLTLFLFSLVKDRKNNFCWNVVTVLNLETDITLAGKGEEHRLHTV